MEDWSWISFVAGAALYMIVDLIGGTRFRFGDRVKGDDVDSPEFDVDVTKDLTPERLQDIFNRHKNKN